tara:strand:- start:566 stop:1048 length:483 start_codon:yes stop_codon:yes gene_type:complete
MGFVQNMRGLFRKKKSSKSKSKKRTESIRPASLRSRQSLNRKTPHTRKNKRYTRTKRRTRTIRISPIEIYTYRNIINVMNDTKKYKDINIRNYHGMGEKVEATMSNLQKTAEELYNYIQELKNNDRIRSNDENLPGFKLQYIILKKNYDKAKTDAINYTI